MRIPPFLLAGLLAAGALAAPPFARAEGEESMAEVLKKVREQMQKVARLMRENEKALLEISTGRDAEARAVDVDVEPPREGASESESPQTPPPDGAEGSPAGSDATPGTAGGRDGAGERSVREIDELLRERGRKAGQIPGELEELVRMIPRQSQSAPGSGERKKPGESSQPQETRDTKRLGEREQRQPNDAKPDSTPGDDPQRTPPDDEPERPRGREGDVPGWSALLPPEAREAVRTGDFAKVPPEYQDLVRRYLDVMRRQSARTPSR